MSSPLAVWTIFVQTVKIVITSGLRNYFVVVVLLVLVVGSNAKCDIIRRINVAECYWR